MYELKDVLGPIVSVCAAAISVYFSSKQTKFTRENFKIQRGNDIFKWGGDAIDLLSKAETLAFKLTRDEKEQNEFYEEKRDILSRLSGCIDKGRMYFPNMVENIHGADKDEGYRGYRQPILNFLMGAYECIKQYKINDKDTNHKIRPEITDYKRKVVSELQSSIDPRRRIEFLQKEVGHRQPGGNKK